MLHGAPQCSTCPGVNGADQSSSIVEYVWMLLKPSGGHKRNATGLVHDVSEGVE